MSYFLYSGQKAGFGTFETFLLALKYLSLIFPYDGSEGNDNETDETDAHGINFAAILYHERFGIN